MANGPQPHGDLKMSNLKITISGTVGSGKSTTAQVIMDALAQKGAIIEYDNPDNLGLDTQGELFTKAAEILQGMTINVSEVQTRRAPNGIRCYHTDN